MAAHRYWRSIAIEAYGAGDLELSCFHLLDVAGVRVDAPATLTASTAPTTGALANLQDDDLTTDARWAAQSVATLTLNWDFGVSSVDAADIRLAGDSNARFPLIAKIQYSDDSVAWVELIIFAGIAWPGVEVKTSSDAGGVVRNTVKGRAASTDAVNLTIESGAVKDYITGVMGTGRGRVAGTIKEKGTPDAPVYRKVRLIRERDSLLIREVWSHPVTGAYSFDYVDELQLFTVLSYDHTGAFRAVVADRIVPELIP